MAKMHSKMHTRTLKARVTRCKDRKVSIGHMNAFFSASCALHAFVTRGFPTHGRPSFLKKMRRRTREKNGKRCIARNPRGLVRDANDYARTSTVCGRGRNRRAD